MHKENEDCIKSQFSIIQNYLHLLEEYKFYRKEEQLLNSQTPNFTTTNNNNDDDRFSSMNHITNFTGVIPKKKHTKKLVRTVKRQGTNTKSGQTIYDKVHMMRVSSILESNLNLFSSGVFNNNFKNPDYKKDKHVNFQLNLFKNNDSDRSKDIIKETNNTVIENPNENFKSEECNNTSSRDDSFERRGNKFTTEFIKSKLDLKNAIEEEETHELGGDLSSRKIDSSRKFVRNPYIDDMMKKPSNNSFKFMKNNNNNFKYSMVSQNSLIYREDVQELKFLKNELNIYKQYFETLSNQIEHGKQNLTEAVKSIDDFQYANCEIYKEENKNLLMSFGNYKEFFDEEIKHRNSMINSLNLALEEMLMKYLLYY